MSQAEGLPARPSKPGGDIWVRPLSAGRSRQISISPCRVAHVDRPRPVASRPCCAAGVSVLAADLAVRSAEVNRAVRCASASGTSREFASRDQLDALAPSVVAQHPGGQHRVGVLAGQARPSVSVSPRYIFSHDRPPGHGAAAAGLAVNARAAGRMNPSVSPLQSVTLSILICPLE